MDKLSCANQFCGSSRVGLVNLYFSNKLKKKKLQKQINNNLFRENK